MMCAGTFIEFVVTPLVKCVCNLVAEKLGADLMKNLNENLAQWDTIAGRSNAHSAGLRSARQSADVSRRSHRSADSGSRSRVAANEQQQPIMPTNEIELEVQH